MGDKDKAKGRIKRLAFDADGHPHTLVHVFLRGGADTLNLLVPYGDDAYYRERPTLGIARPGAKLLESVLPLDDFHGLHPRLKPLEALYKSGQLGFVQGVGTDNPTGSHFEAQDQIEHGLGFESSQGAGGGWLGRHLRSRKGPAAGPLSAVAMRPTMPEVLRGAPAASAITAIDDLQIEAPKGERAAADRVARALGQLYGAETDLLGHAGRGTLDLLERVQALRSASYTPAGGASYGGDGFGRALREVARLIKAEVGLEVACVDLDGWDTHFVQGTTGGAHGNLADRLASGLAAFWADLEQRRSRVTVVVMTEFGRRVYENSSLGTDHGRGFTMFALGEDVAGGQVHGRYPTIEDAPVGSELLGPGGLPVLIDYRDVLAEVLSCSVGGADLPRVFPGFAPSAVGLIA